MRVLRLHQNVNFFFIPMAKEKFFLKKEGIFIQNLKASRLHFLEKEKMGLLLARLKNFVSGR